MFRGWKNWKNKKQHGQEGTRSVSQQESSALPGCMLRLKIKRKGKTIANPDTLTLDLVIHMLGVWCSMRFIKCLFNVYNAYYKTFEDSENLPQVARTLRFRKLTRAYPLNHDPVCWYRLVNKWFPDPRRGMHVYNTIVVYYVKVYWSKSK